LVGGLILVSLVPGCLMGNSQNETLQALQAVFWPTSTQCQLSGRSRAVGLI
jgi:hypothetical protein